VRAIHIHWEENRFNDSRICYAINFLDTHPLKPNDVRVLGQDSTGNESILMYSLDKTAKIPAQNGFFRLDKAIQTSYSASEFNYKESKVHGVTLSKVTNVDFYQNGKFGFDILETIFFHISRYEEFYANEEDLSYTNCLEETKQFLVRHELYETPVVDHLVKAFFESLLNIDLQKKTTYSISHDIDLLWRFKPNYKIARNVIADIYHRRGIDKIKRGISYFSKMKREKLKDPYDCFHFLFRPEGFWKSKVLYLMVGGETKFDNKYSIDDPKVAEIISSAKELGYKIGLHPSYNCLNKPSLYTAEKKTLENKINDAVLDNRQHVLRWEWKQTPNILEDSGIQSDSTMGFTRRLGFRSGTGYKYQLYDLNSEYVYGFYELPMSFMESSAIHYASENNKSISEVMRSFLNKNKFNTHIEMNVHNSNFDPTLIYGQEMVEFYTKTLNEIIE